MSNSFICGIPFIIILFSLGDGFKKYPVCPKPKPYSIRLPGIILIPQNRLTRSKRPETRTTRPKNSHRWLWGGGITFKLQFLITQPNTKGKELDSISNSFTDFNSIGKHSANPNPLEFKDSFCE